jgi:subtilisin family serine protease
MFALMLLVFISGATGWMVKAEDGGGEGPTVQNKPQILSSRFNEQERLRVIVQLNVPGETKQAELMTPAIHTTQNELMTTMDAYNVRLIHEYDYIPFMAMEVDRAAFEGLLNSPLVVGIEEDILMKPLLTESVPLINADDVWAAGYTGEGQVVAVLDTGVDKNHPALAGKVVSEACYSTNNVDYAATSLCPGGVSQSTLENSALPYINNCPSGECDHGTHVAGIVAANNTTVKGVAKDASLIAIQVFSKIDNSYYCGSEPTPCVLSFTSDQLKGLERVYSLRSSFSIASVNLSLGGEAYSNTCDAVGVNISYKSAIDVLRSVGIVTIAASGNNGYTNAIASPACISSVVSVGATTKTDFVASYSNSSELLDILAPGGDIYIGTGINSTLPYDKYGYKSGTSMAAPHVAGAWALIRSAVPGASVDNILYAFKTTGKPIYDSRNGLTFPRIDVFAALESLLKISLTPSLAPPLSIGVSWQDIYDGESGYSIARRFTGDTDWISIDTTLSNVEIFTDTNGLVCEADYEYKVTPIGIIGELTPAETTSLLCAPDSVTKISGTQERIVFSWNDLSAQETSYQVERYDSKKEEWVSLASLVSNTTYYNDVGLVCGISYLYRIKALQSIDAVTAYNLSPEIELFTNPCGPPPTPENLTGRALSLYSIQLIWDDVLDDETGYKIERYNKDSLTWNTVGSVSENVVIWEDTGLDAYQDYQYRVISFNTHGDSAPSEPVTVSTNFVQVFLPLLTK